MTGGGTAGHVTPNIAMIPKLEKDGHKIYYIGTENGIENKLIKNEGVDYYTISAGKLRRYLSMENIKDISKIAKGFVEASLHIKNIKPDIVFSKGGFVSCPVVWAAWINKIPVIIHESDLTPGLANKLSMPFAKKVCHAFPETEKYISKEKAALTGIPVRDKIKKGDKNKGLNLCNFDKSKNTILVIGGSLGSKFINELIRSSLDDLLKKYNICHICGAGAIDETLSNKKGYKQFEYVGDELSDLFAMSDLVISRAGATTLYELLTLTKPNILIPLSAKSSRGDQILNANFFKKEGYSEVIDEDTATKDALINTITKVFGKKNHYVKNMKKSNLRNGSDTIINLIKDISKK